MEPTVTVQDAAPAAAAAAPKASPIDPVKVLSPNTASALDARGRRVVVKKLSLVDRARLFRAMGGEAAENRPFLSYALIAGAVTEIDGVPVPFPQTLVAIDGTLARLEDDGVAAALKALDALAPPEEDVADAAKNLS